MLAVATSAVVASLLGSLHCLGMCGPLLALAVDGKQHTVAPRLRGATWHSLGRLVTYVALGFAAGGVGKALDLAAQVGSIQKGAALLSGLLLIGWGVALLLPRQTASTIAPGLFAQRLVQLRRRKPSLRAFLMGTLTGLLPCGWLWAFIATAAGTGAPVSGGAVMFGFWLGTLPAMVGIVSLTSGIFAKLGARRSVLVAVMMILLGGVTLWMRWRDAGAAGVAAPSCHTVKGRP